jgi:uncharacterized protein YndB with AHSA1/START domain
MTVTKVRKDHGAMTLAITAEFKADPERAWSLWSDPRQLERWWGPPGYPATVVDHDFVPGGYVRYYMSGPDHQPHGWWRFLAIDAPRSLEFENGLADEHGEPDPGMPVMVVRASLTGLAGGGTRMTVEATFPDADAMAQFLEMGMEEGMAAAVGQIDGILDAGVHSGGVDRRETV